MAIQLSGQDKAAAPAPQALSASWEARQLNAQVYQTQLALTQTTSMMSLALSKDWSLCRCMHFMDICKQRC